MSETSENEPIVASPEDVGELQAELERLKTENASLKAKSGGGGGRTAWAIALAIIAALLFTIAVPAVWINRVVMDTDTWVATVAPLASDPAIQDAVATMASDRLIEALDAQTRLEALLPEQLQQLAPIIASSAEGFVRTQTTDLVRSDQFADIWTELNRAGHTALIAALTGSRDGAFKYEPGVLTLDVGVLAEKVQAKLLDSGLSFLARVPVGSIDKQVEIFNSPALAQASAALDLMNKLAFVIPIVAILLIAIAFGIATDRRRVAVWLGAGIAAAGLLPLQAVYLGQYPAVKQLQELADLPSSAAQNAYNIVFAQLIASERVVVVLGLIVLGGAILAGPAKWAVAMRSGLSGGLAGVATHLELGRFGEWVAARKSGLRAAGIIAAVLVLLVLPAPRSLGQVVWLAVGIVVWFFVVELLGAGETSRAEPLDAASTTGSAEAEPDAEDAPPPDAV